MEKETETDRDTDTFMRNTYTETHKQKERHRDRERQREKGERGEERWILNPESMHLRRALCHWGTSHPTANFCLC